MKEAATLAKAAYGVLVLGGWTNPLLKKRDQQLMTSVPFRYIPVFDTTADALSRTAARVRTKLGVVAHRLGYENRWQLGHAYYALRGSKFVKSADLYIAHSEPAMAVAMDLLRRGCRVGLDMEDWFSEDLLPDARRFRPLRLLRFLEVELLTRAAFASCPSRAMSQVLSQEHRCAAPATIYNAFPLFERKSLDGAMKDRSNRRIPSIYWFSQTLGTGRGLEELLAALSFVKHKAEVHLRGNAAAGFKKWLFDHVPVGWRERIFIHPLVPNEELLSRIAEHDIGFAGELTFCRNRDLTVTNKILHYLLGGLAVVASNTTGQREVAEQARGAVFLYPPGDAYSIAEVFNVLLASPEKLTHAKACALRAAEQTFCWERQEKVLLEAIGRAMGRPVRYDRTQ
jgi:glycosyltransferase involved in cell wall biosynthesis